MDDTILIENKWYVLATSSRADDRTLGLKQGETFGLFDRHGDIQHIGGGIQGRLLVTMSSFGGKYGFISTHTMLSFSLVVAQPG